jgi:hypothetical protein
MIFFRGNVMSTAIILNDVELHILMNSLVVVEMAMVKSQTTLGSQMTIAQLKHKLDNQFNIQNPIIDE